jgi:hypothetical protein
MRRTLVLAALILNLVPVGRTEEIISIAWPTGVYRIDSTTGGGQEIGFPAVTGMNSLARSPAGEFYTVDASSNLLVINPTTGAATPGATLNFGSATPVVPALAFSPSGTLYAIQRGNSDDLYTINLTTGQGTLVGPTGSGPLQGLAFAPNGTLYGWNIFSGLVTINPANGAATDVNPAEDASAQIQCLAFAPDGTLYGAQYGLFTIDTATGVPSAAIATGFSDIRGMEFNTGPALRLSIAAAGNNMSLCWLTRTNQSYQIQRRANLETTNAWENIGPLLPGTGGELCVTNQMNAARRFFRVIAISH